MKKTKNATPKEEARYQKRKTAVDAVQQGDSPVVVARVLHVPLRTLFYWLALYRHGGYHALREGQRSGRPRKVNGEVMRWLYYAITLGDPLQYQFEFCLWNLGIIRAMLKRHQGVELSKSGVSRLLRHLGLSPQVPIYRSYKQNPQEMRKYLKRTYPEVVRQARRTGAIIYFVDEAAVRADGHRGTTWGIIGNPPVVEDSGDRHTFKLISAVSARGDLKFAVFEGRMNGERFVAFLKKLRADTGKPIIVITDNARYHTHGPVKRYEQPTEEGIQVAHLPSYAPELNPDEQVWNHLKRRIGKMLITSKAEMKRQVKNILLSIQRSVKLVQSFFQLKDTKYAAKTI
jgi:transposase